MTELSHQPPQLLLLVLVERGKLLRDQTVLFGNDLPVDPATRRRQADAVAPSVGVPGNHPPLLEFVEKLGDVAFGYEKPTGEVSLHQPFGLADLSDNIELRQAEITGAQPLSQQRVLSVREPHDSQPESHRSSGTFVFLHLTACLSRCSS